MQNPVRANMIFWSMFGVKLVNITLILCIFCFFFTTFLLADDFTYGSKGKRDPFIPLAGLISDAAMKELINVTSIQDIVLEGIVYDKNSAAAIINGTFVKAGIRVGLVFIEAVEPKKVISLIEGARHEVPLIKKEGGG